MNEEKIFNLAKELNGVVSLTYLYAYSDLKLENIEKILSKLETKSYLITEINNETGAIKYIFPNLINNKLEKKYNNKIDKIIDFSKEILFRIKKKNFETKLYSNLLKYNINEPLINFEKIILQIAYIKNGKLSIEDIYDYIPLSMEEIEEIIKSLSNKGLCKKEFYKNIVIYVFNDVINDNLSQNNNFIEKIKNYYITNILNIPNKIKSISKNKTFKYIYNKNGINFLNFILPGYLLLRNKQVNTIKFIIYFVLPLMISGFLSYIPQIFISRYYNLKYYSLSENLFNKQLANNIKYSLLYSIIFAILYYFIIGFEGLSNYYKFILSILGYT